MGLIKSTGCYWNCKGHLFLDVIKTLRSFCQRTHTCNERSRFSRRIIGSRMLRNYSEIDCGLPIAVGA
jgi:hypothetical protein